MLVDFKGKNKIDEIISCIAQYGSSISFYHLFFQLNEYKYERERIVKEIQELQRKFNE